MQRRQDLCRPTLSGIQHQDNSCKGTSGIEGKSEVATGWVLGDSFLLGNLQKPGRAIVPSLRPPPHKALKWVAPPQQLPKATPCTSYSCLLYNGSRYQDRESKQLHLMHRNKHRKAVKLRRQRNMVQMKEENKAPEKELNKLEISNLSGAELKHWL